MEDPNRGESGFRADEACALALDAADPLRGYRARFLIPRRPDGEPATYLCGNSLGLQPATAAEAVDRELGKWAELGVDGHFAGERPWYSYHELLRDSSAAIVGARPDEVVMMNGLTVNLHLMMVTFYRPTAERYRILVEDCTFPSDTYAVKSQIRYHGHDPEDALIVARPREGEATLRTEDIVATLEREGESIAVVLFSGVNYFTGQRFDIETISAAARAHGCVVGFDLAHAAGNVPLRLHDWNVDFAVWCTYKYLNAGPGAVAGCFVHRRHGTDLAAPRFAGWWGNDPETRFLMHLQPEFSPRAGADGWQLSNPPILAMAPLRASLDLFDEVGMAALRAKSVRLTGYLQFLLDRIPTEVVEVITPREPEARGCQLSIRVRRRPRELFRRLHDHGFVGDVREPDVIRVAPVPLYNTFHEVWRLAAELGRDVEDL